MNTPRNDSHFGPQPHPSNSHTQILALSLSQDLPPASPTQFTAQVFSVGVAALGLAAFALVLALVEQVRG